MLTMSFPWINPALDITDSSQKMDFADGDPKILNIAILFYDS